MLRDSLRDMELSPEQEGAAARKRFVVYWLRPAIAALGFGLFTFLVTALPGEKEKIQLRTQIHAVTQKSVELAERIERLNAQVRALLPAAQAIRAEQLVVVDSRSSDSQAAHGRLAFDFANGQGVLSLRGIEAAADQRAFGWLVVDGERRPLAAIDLKSGAGDAAVRVDAAASGSIEITLESIEGEPDGSGDALLTLYW